MQLAILCLMKAFLQNKDVEMLIILPDEVTGLDYILSNIRQFDEAKIKEASKEAYVKLYLPKFKVASDTFILNGYLRQVINCVYNILT